MFKRFTCVLCLAIILPCVFVSCSKDDDEPFDVTVDFQDVDIPNDPGYIDNAEAGLAGVFREGIISFPNYYNAEYGSWSGFAYSQVHDVTTNSYTNYGVYAVKDPSTNKFMIAYVSDPNDYSPNLSLSFSKPVKDLSFDIANAAYAALTMKDGGFGAKKFTGTDWFKLTIVARSTEGTETVTIPLGDGTKITNVWNTIPFTFKNITKLDFSLASSDNGEYGMNTPAYFCIDNIKARTVK